MTIKQLKAVLQKALSDAEDFDDNEKLHLESNTYFVNGARFFLGVSGYDGGYLDLEEISSAIEFDDSKCPKCKAELEWDEDGNNPYCPECGWTEDDD